MNITGNQYVQYALKKNTFIHHRTTSSHNGFTFNMRGYYIFISAFTYKDCVY